MNWCPLCNGIITFHDKEISQVLIEEYNKKVIREFLKECSVLKMLEGLIKNQDYDTIGRCIVHTFREKALEGSE